MSRRLTAFEAGADRGGRDRRALGGHVCIRSKEKRLTPIFSELRHYLLEAQELAPEKEDRVFPDVREDSNFRTETTRILKRVGVTDEIPRFFQNCRNSWQTEPEAEFPLHISCAAGWPPVRTL